MSAEQKDALILKLVSELQDALDRLNQTPHNSSRPPSSAPPWAGTSGESPEAERGESSGAEAEPSAPAEPAGEEAEAAHSSGERQDSPQGSAQQAARKGRPGTVGAWNCPSPANRSMLPPSVRYVGKR